MEEKLNITVSGDKLEIRTGAALPLKEPVSYNFKGIIDSVPLFLQQRKETLNPKECAIIVCKDKKEILLVVNDKSAYQDKISGSLEFDSDFVKFGINSSEKKWGLRALSDFIKMNRSFFTGKEEAMKLVEILRNFEGTIEKKMEQSSDTRANKKTLLHQTVDSNIPKAFILNMPIFKGQEKVKFEVEVNIIPRELDMDCYLESVEAAEIVQDQTEKIISEEITKIQEISPEIVILYQ